MKNYDTFVGLFLKKGEAEVFLCYLWKDNLNKHNNVRGRDKRMLLKGSGYGKAWVLA